MKNNSPFDLNFSDVLSEFKNTLKKFFLILAVVIMRRGVDVIHELISGKVIIPIIFFILASKIQMAGMDSTLNSVIQLGVGGVGTAGVLFYKLKKDTKSTKGCENEP